MQAPTAQPPAQGFDPATAAAFEQMRSQVSPKEFSSEMLSAAEQADPAAVQQLKQALSGIQLPQEVIDAMQQMVEVILRDPQNYPAIRQEMLSDGIPAELLPEQFDPMFFGALRVALDQIEAEAGGQPVQAFAMGGIANLRPIAQAMQGMGRGQDTMLAHINPQEARVLQMMGGIGTINPTTGLREYGFFKSLAKPFKAVGKAISGAVKGIVNGVKDFAKSSIGRIVTSVALGFFLGPAAAGFLGVSSVAGVAAVSGFVGGFGSSVLAGSSFKDALKNGAIGGVTAGATAGITGGMGAFESGSYAGPTTVAGQWDKAINSGKSLLGISTPSTAGTSISAEQLGTAVDSIDAAAGVPTVEQLANVPPPDLTVGQQAIQAPASGIGGPGINVAAVQSPVVTDVGTLGLGPSPAPAPSYLGMDLSSAQGAVDPLYGMDLSSAQGAVDPLYGMDLSSAQGAIGPSYAGMDLSSAQGARGPSYAGMDLSSAQGATGPSYAGMDLGSAQGAAGPSYAGMDLSSAQGTMGGPSYSGMDLGSAQGVVEGVNPYARAPSVMGYLSEGQYYDAAKQAFMPASYSNIELIQSPQYQNYLRAGFTPKEALSMASSDLNPSMLRTYAPITGAALGAAYLGGAFTPKEPGSPNLAPKETGTDLLRAQPGVYGTTPGGANVTYASLPTGYNYNPMQMLYRPQVTMGNPYGNIYGQRRMFAQGGIAAVAPAKFNLGGYASGGIGSMAKKYPRRTGQISGPGTGTSDDIPAMLSDGEFVMTAKAVRGAGKGSRREGAKRMYAMMRKFEGKA
jgi:hypothetical protein